MHVDAILSTCKAYIFERAKKQVISEAYLKYVCSIKNKERIMSDKYKIKVSLHIGLKNARRDEELDLCAESGKTEAELDALSDEELQKVINETWEDWAWNYIDGYGELLKERSKP
jgi:hypothetical protein